jgi:hypothetical protein
MASEVLNLDGYDGHIIRQSILDAITALHSRNLAVAFYACDCLRALQVHHIMHALGQPKCKLSSSLQLILLEGIQQFKESPSALRLHFGSVFNGELWASNTLLVVPTLGAIDVNLESTSLLQRVSRACTSRALTIPQASMPLHHAVPGSTTAWHNIGGLSQVVKCIRDGIEAPLLNRAHYRHMNVRPPRGVLLFGAPGTGKTRLIRALAAATGCELVVLSGDVVLSAYVGEAEAQLRNVFAQARRSAHSIIFFDELDALVGNRLSHVGDAAEG